MMKKIGNPFEGMKLHEYLILIPSILLVVVAFFIVPEKDYLSSSTAILGIVMVIFVAKAHVFGQFLALIDAILYAIVAYIYHYYGELIICICLYMPIAIMAIVSWAKNKYKETEEVKVEKLGIPGILGIALVIIATAIASFFILRALNTPNLIVSVASVSVSAAGGYLIIKRSPYYALLYMINDIVLAVLWGLAAKDAHQYWPLAISFIGYFASDTYGFINWFRLRNKQHKDLEDNNI